MPSRREREEALIAGMRKPLTAYREGTELEPNFVPLELHEAIDEDDVHAILSALEAAHRREDAIRHAAMTEKHHPLSTILSILDGDEVKHAK